jgi:phosphoglycolate phosphatase
MARPIRAIIFDLDGTLADTIGAIRDGINRTMRAYSYPQRTYDDVRRAIGNGARLLVQRCMPEPDASNGQQLSRVLATYDMAYADTYLNTRECYEGMVETVKELHRRGYRLAVLSNKQDTYTTGLVDQLFPDGEFEVVMGQTDLPTKPNPTVPHLIAHQLCVAPDECAMIGDSDVDIVTARNAGMKGVGCAWGYRGRNMLLAAGAPCVVNTPAELLDLFPPVKEPCFDAPEEDTTQENADKDDSPKEDIPTLTI